jgi:hypothetical protein
MVYVPAGKYIPIFPWSVYACLIIDVPVLLLTISNSIVDKRPPVMRTVPDRYAFVIPLGIVKGIDTDDAAGTE